MIPSLSRRHTLRESLPSFFDSKKSSWPDPQDSVGQECCSFAGLQCWQVIGPAAEVMKKLSLPIKDLLEKHRELLEQGESKPRAVSFNMWMVGHLPTTAEPTIVFSSRSKRQRTCAKALLKESKLLDEFPGVKIKTLDKRPAIYQSAKHRSDAAFGDGPDDGVYMVDDAQRPCGALVSFGHSGMATMGGVLLINGIHYGISAQHTRLDPLPEAEDVLAENASPCFDDDSDTENDDAIDITSKYSVSSCSDDEDEFDSSASSPTSSLFDHPSRIQSQNRQLIEELAQPNVFSGRPISQLSNSPVENDLDYEVFKLDDRQLHRPNSISLPSTEGSVALDITPSRVVRHLVESEVWAATGTTGSVHGTILKTPYFIKMERSHSFQEMWAVRLDRQTIQGDCGAWVVDSRTGDVYGHIVAGDPYTGLAFIIPAYKVFEDIEQRFGVTPAFPTARSPSREIAKLALTAIFESQLAPAFGPFQSLHKRRKFQHTSNDPMGYLEGDQLPTGLVERAYPSISCLSVNSAKPWVYIPSIMEINSSLERTKSADTRHRMLLEHIHEVLEDSSTPISPFIGRDIGVPVGGSLSNYEPHSSGGSELAPRSDTVECADSLLANRISHFLDFGGLSAIIDTACSSRLLDVHVSCQSLRGDVKPLNGLRSVRHLQDWRSSTMRERGDLTIHVKKHQRPLDRRSFDQHWVPKVVGNTWNPSFMNPSTQTLSQHDRSPLSQVSPYSTREVPKEDEVPIIGIPGLLTAAADTQELWALIGAGYPYNQKLTNDLLADTGHAPFDHSLHGPNIFSPIFLRSACSEPFPNISPDAEFLEIQELMVDRDRHNVHLYRESPDMNSLYCSQCTLNRALSSRTTNSSSSFQDLSNMRRAQSVIEEIPDTSKMFECGMVPVTTLKVKCAKLGAARKPKLRLRDSRGPNRTRAAYKASRDSQWYLNYLDDMIRGFDLETLHVLRGCFGVPLLNFLGHNYSPTLAGTRSRKDGSNGDGKTSFAFHRFGNIPGPFVSTRSVSGHRQILPTPSQESIIAIGGAIGVGFSATFNTRQLQEPRFPKEGSSSESAERWEISISAAQQSPAHIRHQPSTSTTLPYDSCGSVSNKLLPDVEFDQASGGRGNSEDDTDILTLAQSRRKAGNEAAQRAFRERQARQVKGLDQGNERRGAPKTTLKVGCAGLGGEGAEAVGRSLGNRQSPGSIEFLEPRQASAVRCAINNR